MEIKDLQSKLVAVLGYGQEGRAVAAYLIKHGVKPTLFDQKPWKDWPADEQEAIKKLGVNFIFGPDCFKELAGFDVAFRSPGIRLADLQLATNNLQLTSQTKWFFEHCPCKIIGVTGTKGKGTTASLIYQILSCSVPIYGRPSSPINRHATLGKPYLTGNIGKTQPLEILDDLKPDDWIVYELSSFQLQDLDRSPHIGVVLMTTSEHLDYHANLEEYVNAKSAITKFQNADDFAVINQDYPNSVTIGKLGKGKKFYFSREKALDDGCFLKDDAIVIPGSDFRLPTSDLQLRGAHNLENICAAVSVAKILGVDDKTIRDATYGFNGLEHRLEFVGEKNGIKFYNDSFSTTPETAIAAIQAFSEPEIIILGGSSKNSDFGELGKTINESKNIRAVILIGEEAVKIKSALFIKHTKNTEPHSFSRGSDEASAKLDKEGVGGVKILEGAKNMAGIFKQIKPIATKGDVVLLSPACASFDMFKSYVDRGDQFKEAAKKF